MPGSEGPVAADGFGLDSATGDMYMTDIFGNGIWRFTPRGSAQLWTSVATNPLLVLPDGVKVFDNAVYDSIEAGKILRIPINPTAAPVRRPSGLTWTVLASSSTTWCSTIAPGTST